MNDHWFLAIRAWRHGFLARRLVVAQGLTDAFAWAAKAPDVSTHGTLNLPRIAKTVNRVVRYGMPRGTCLIRSLVLLRILSEAGCAASLRIGIRLVNSQALAAHAWVEIDGIPVNDRPDIATDFHVVPLDEALNSRIVLAI